MALFAAALICLVVAGSLLGNSFVAGRMTVAAANKSWLPSYLSIVGKFGKAPRSAPESDDSQTDTADEIDNGASPM